MLRVIFALIFMFTICRGDCPDMCLCYNYPRESLPQTYLYFTSVTCKGYSENTTFDNNTRLLEITDLKEDDVGVLLAELLNQELPFLNQLIIKNCEFYGNVSLVFDGLENIYFLSLTHDNLEAVPVIFLNRTITSNINSADFSSNNITIIQNKPFRTLQSLEVLNLSDNSITNIYVDSFSALKNLKYLDLSQNYLTSLKDNVLLPLSSLQYLNLSNNHLEVLNELCFSNLVMLQQLDVSWNRLAKVAPGSLQLPSLARLLLAGNPKLGGSREVLVSTGGRLQTVDASRTGLKQVPAALTHSIRTLRLAGNSIKRITCGELDSYPLLQLLDFSSNAIVAIEDDALGRLEFLSVLYLTDNNIHEIPRTLPEKLTVLHLEHNKVVKVTRDVLLGLRDLEVLLLSDNNIKVVEEGAFAHLISLVTLDLSRNPLSALTPGSLSGPKALQVLRLSSIGSVSPARDASFPLLATERLISLDLFASAGLARQFLADTAALAASRDLQELDISNTNLKFLRSDLLFYLPQLRILHVRGNRLNCSDLYWLATWMRRREEQEYRDIVCGSPSELLGTSVVDLQQNNGEITSMKSINQDQTDRRTTINLIKENVIVSENISSTTELSTTQSMKNVLKTFSENTFMLNLVKVDANKHESRVQSNPLNESDIITQEELSSTLTQKSSNLTRKVSKSKQIKTSEVPKFKNSSNTNDVIFPLLNNNNRTKAYFRSKIAKFNKLESNKTMIKLNFSISSTNLVEKLDILNSSPASETSRRQGFARTDLLSGKNSRNSNEKSFNATTMDSTGWIPGDETFTIDSNMTENSSQWNAPTGEMSMYTNPEPQEKLLHPGMFILAAGVLLAGTILAILAARLTRHKRNDSLFEEDIEVSSIPSVTELW